jgi:tetratricopeptide (TPR) repeat protein
MRRDVSLMATALLATAPLAVPAVMAAEPINGLDARERAPAVALVVFQDMTGGAAILRGSYQAGLEEAASALARHPNRNEFALKANICAAQLRLGQVEAANESCEAALASRPPMRAAMAPRQFRAVAHVNHGVVHYVQGDHEFARQEFRRARSMYPSLQVAASNLEFTEEALRKPRIEVGETL